MVAAHLVKNAHRYWDINPEQAKRMKIEAETEVTRKSGNLSLTDDKQNCIEVNKILREIRSLKQQNRIREQQSLTNKMKEGFGSFREISRISGTSLKTVHEWCSIPKEREHSSTSRAKLRKEEFVNFLMQDTITFSSSCKRYANKRFMVDTWEEIYKKYLQQPEYHKHGVISKSTMRNYKPKSVLLSSSTPVLQCLCDYCENIELMTKALVAAGVKGIPSSKYLCIDATLCDITVGQFGTDYKFRHHNCIQRQCTECGKGKLKLTLDNMNGDLLKLNRTVSWHKWEKIEGFSAPQKCLKHKPLSTALNEFLNQLEDLAAHCFRSSWHRRIFAHIKKNLDRGWVLQVMDFAMNFNNWYQDEVQAAYWCGTQTTIHATINFFKCPRKKCNELVTLALVHISDDLRHDSFLSRAAQNLTFKYLANLGFP